MTPHPLRQLQDLGQAVWLDFIDRDLVTGGRLERLVTEDGLSGVTSNPTIFEKAIARTSRYDASLGRLLAARPGADAGELYEALALEDVRQAADALRPVHEASGGRDGFVCLEVSPDLAHDAEGTVEEARRLHARAERPNVMVKVPGTREGVPAIERLVAEGVPVNVTLLFCVAQYEAVARAYLRGAAEAREPARAASVASVFVSRVDTAVDRALEAMDAPDARGLRGEAAIANARLIHARFLELFEGTASEPRRARGVAPQRLLWASTSAKDPAFRDVRYVEELVARGTVSTMPPETLDAFRDHGLVRGETARAGLDEARTVVARLASLGIDLDRVGEDLQREGVAKFAASFHALLAALDAKRRRVGPVQ